MHLTVFRVVFTILAVCTLGFAPQANATVITGTFTGTVLYSFSDTHNDFGGGFGDDTIDGLTVTGSFTYDSADFLAPNAQIYGTLTGASTNSWIHGQINGKGGSVSITEIVNGRSFTFTGGNFSQVDVHSIDGPSDFSGFGIQVNNSPQGEAWVESYAYNSPTQITSNINDLGATNFNGIAGQFNSNNFYSYTRLTDGAGYLMFVSTQIQAGPSVEATSTPTPDTLAVLALGLGILGFTRRRPDVRSR